ncbi:MAG: class I SAM-dependent methyltransferase [Armatimonadetes bacterium]|nr:class I SAM-dependent methyltransferase [Armatimonadota bacterium]
MLCNWTAAVLAALTEEELRRTAEFWGDEHRAALCQGGGVRWDRLERVQRRVNEKISGAPDVDWIDYVKATYLSGRAPVERCLSLCCWQGELERELARRGVFRWCVAYDISEPALARAREKAAEEGINNVEFVCQDVNTMVLAEKEFDLIVAKGALHHIANLEGALEQINRGLKDDGILVALEYVGPNRFNYPPRQLEIATCALRLLPEQFRQSVTWRLQGRAGLAVSRRSAGAWMRLLWLKLKNKGVLEAVSRRLYHAWLRKTGRPLVKTCVPRIVGSEMAIDDPTEAIRSADVVPLIEQKLRLIEYKPLGGTLLMPVLHDIAGNFEAGAPAADQLLDMLFAIEDALMAAGEIGSDFAFIVAGKRCEG